METSVELLGSEDTEMSSSEPTLLLLNDDCLIQISKCLELLDLVNLSKTCVRLKNIAADTFNQRFKIVTVNDISDCDFPEHCTKVTRRQFCDALSVIGRRVESVEVYEGYDFIFQVVTSKCQNVKSLYLLFSESPDSPPLSLETCPHLKEFKMLNKLKIFECDISKKALRQIFLNNPGIETLQSDYTFKGFVKLLARLPKLKTLHVGRIHGLGVNKVPNIFHLKEVENFQFESSEKCNKFINKLATKWMLVSLQFICDADDETFDSLKLFVHLENLKISNMTTSSHLPERTVFPSKLKCLAFYNIKLTLRKLTSLVKELRMLERITVEPRDIIGFSAGQDSEIIAAIVTALSPVLHLQHRTLKLLYGDGWSNDKGKYFYDSENLKILNRCKKEEKKFLDEWVSERTLLRII